MGDAGTDDSHLGMDTRLSHVHVQAGEVGRGHLRTCCVLRAYVRAWGSWLLSITPLLQCSSAIRRCLHTTPCHMKSPSHQTRATFREGPISYKWSVQEASQYLDQEEFQPMTHARGTCVRT
jgi:hypothetical protein